MKKEGKMFFISFILLIILSVGLLCYKMFLIYSIKVSNKNVTSINDKARKELGNKINISLKKTSKYKEYEDILIEDIFGDAKVVSETKDGNIYEVSEESLVSLSLVQTNHLDEYKSGKHDYWFINYQKYLKKYKINKSYDVYKFLANFEKKKISILTPIFTLKDYLFQSEFYLDMYSSFDIAHKITGDLSGVVTILNEGTNRQIITYDLDFLDKHYYIYFLGNQFNLESTVNIISTIKQK